MAIEFSAFEGSMATSQINFLGNYINGEFIKTQKSDESWQVVSPADTSDEVIAIETSYTHVDQACEAAFNAYKKWRFTSLDERKNALMRLQEVYLANSEKMASIISRETGKPTWEAMTEAKALAGKIKITIEHSLKLVEEGRIENALPNTDGVIRYKSRGVMAVVGPFNFPAHLPNGHIVPALLTGNTVVFKPSDKTPAVAQFMAEMFHEAGFPEGVFNLVQGLGETGKRLVGHKLVSGVLFTGSYDVGLRIKQETINQYWKILALEMGGKNTTIVWDDADLKKGIYDTLIGSFLTAGQRCSCTSKLVLHESIYDEFVEKFHAAAKKIKVDHWSNSPFMGPLISKDSLDKYVRFQEIAGREGAESLMRGKALAPSGYNGYYVSPSINLVSQFDPASVYQKSEIFGPNVAVYKVKELEEATEITNASGFGLAMSVFTKDRAIYEQLLVEAQVGLLNWNRTTNGASSRLPFGGMGKSGNDRPSAHFAVNYCTSPIASLEDRNDFDPNAVLPGIEYS